MTKNTNKNVFWASDRGVLVICVGISMIFWLFVKLSKKYSTDVVVPIQYDIPMDRAFKFHPPDEITAKIKGNGWDLLFLSLSEVPKIHITIDPNLENQKISNRDLVKKIAAAIPNKKIAIEDTNFDDILIQTDFLERKVIPIHLKTDIHFKSGRWYGGAIEFSPDSVTIVGPESEIQNFSFWNTQPLVINDLENTIKTSIPLEKPIHNTIKLSPKTVEVLIPVEEQTVKSFFIPVEYINNHDSIRIFPPKVKVSATVGVSKFDQLHIDDYAIVVDFNKIQNKKGQNTIPVSLTRKPDFVRNIQFNPTSIEYFIIQQDTTSSKSKIGKNK